MKQMNTPTSGGTTQQPVTDTKAHTERLLEIRTSVDSIVAGMQDELSKLGFDSAEEFLQNAVQEGGQ